MYAYASEDTAWWSDELGRELGPGTFGENLTVAGIDTNEAVVGSLWQAGEVRALSERILTAQGMHPTAIAVARARLEQRD